jgi:hypothetical protein
MRPRNRTPRSHWDCGIRHKHFCQRFPGLNETAETNPAVSSRPRDIWQIFNFIYVFSVVHCRSNITFLNETAESVPAISMRLRNRIPQSQWDRGIRHENFYQDFRGLNETAGSVSSVSMRPGNRFPRSQWDRGIGSRGLNVTAEILWHCGNPYKNEYWVSFPLKGNHRQNQYICKHCIPIVTRKHHY